MEVQQLIHECTFPEFWQMSHQFKDKSYQFEDKSHQFGNKSQQILNFYYYYYGAQSRRKNRLVWKRCLECVCVSWHGWTVWWRSENNRLGHFSGGFNPHRLVQQIFLMILLSDTRRDKSWKELFGESMTNSTQSVSNAKSDLPPRLVLKPKKNLQKLHFILKDCCAYLWLQKIRQK